MTFRVGQKVVCINNDGLIGCKSPVLGRIYTIREIYTDVIEPRRGVGIYLEEIINGRHLGGKEYGYYSDCFRPVVERKTSIEIFTAMLNPSKQGVEA